MPACDPVAVLQLFLGGKPVDWLRAWPLRQPSDPVDAVVSGPLLHNRFLASLL
jgi:hypothetical protein